MLQFEILIIDILEKKKTKNLMGFTVQRLNDLMKSNFADIHRYEFYMLASFLEITLTEFESRYHVEIINYDIIDFKQHLKERGLKPPGVKFTDKKTEE
jgi:hypothetical protein